MPERLRGLREAYITQLRAQAADVLGPIAEVLGYAIFLWFLLTGR